MPEKLSGLYSNEKFPSTSLASFCNNSAPSTAIFFISSLLFLNTCSRCATDVELYKWITACFAPFTASKVLLIICSLACVKTWTVTSSGIMSRSIRALIKLYSVSDAAGKPTSISLKPILTNIWKNSNFSSKLIGSISAWFPSLKSTLHQIGALSIYSFLTQSYVGVGGIKYCLLYFPKFILKSPFQSIK